MQEWHNKNTKNINISHQYRYEGRKVKINHKKCIDRFQILKPKSVRTSRRTFNSVSHHSCIKPSACPTVLTTIIF